MAEVSQNIFASNVGCNFSDEFVDGFNHRFKSFPPEYIANITLFVNTKRLLESIKKSFLIRSPGFLPKIFSITDLRALAIEHTLPGLLNLQKEQLNLNELIKEYLALSPSTSPISASYELANDLMNLRNEMYSENVSVEKLRSLSKENISSHWQYSLEFLNVIFGYWSKDIDDVPIEAINLEIISILNKKWRLNPPKYPLIIAGSTGSRGITKSFIKLVSKQQKGLIVLPGFDFSQSDKVWDSFQKSNDFEDHPQFRYFELLNELSINPKNIKNWKAEKISLTPRNQLVSLALRPAPVTDQWLEEGPKLTELNSATSGLTLIEAPTSRDEANAIALCIRKAVKDNKSISLITPDRNLLRQVNAALGRWNLIPDNVAGKSLSVTPTGIFLRQIIRLIGQEITAENLIPLLKNPLTNSGGAERGKHMNLVRSIELNLRKKQNTSEEIHEFLSKKLNEPENSSDSSWLHWIQNNLESLQTMKTASLTEFLEVLILTSEKFSNGPLEKEGLLWLENSGEHAKNVLNDLLNAGSNIKILDISEFSNILNFILNKEVVRETVNAHPLIKFWGTLDTRISNTEITILGGMNEGIWPQIKNTDHWLNRSMRKEAGLLSQERKVGLLAHDFQQGINNNTVIITRSERIDDTPSIPSRWLNRITNLLKGLGSDGRNQLDEMKTRGNFWLNLAKAVEEPKQNLTPAKRPSPVPPLAVRPKNLSVTQIETLIRDPYSIYARHVLKLKKLQPLKKQANVLLRGNVIHKIMQNFSEQTKNDLKLINSLELIKLSDDIFSKEVPWPAIRSVWKIQFKKTIPLFLEAEKLRRQNASPLFFEHPGSTFLSEVGITLTAIADRIDKNKLNELLIYDYKSGKPPTLKQLEIFHKQLILEALIAENGGFKNIPAAPVISICYISLNNAHPNTEKIIKREDIEKIKKEIAQLVSYYNSDITGFTARLRMEKLEIVSDYDHLARYGEWDETNSPEKMLLK